MGNLILGMLETACISMGIGAFTGILATLVMKHLSFMKSSPVNEMVTIFLFGYMSYIVAFMIGESGITSLLTCGIVMGHYAWFNLSDNAKLGTGLAF